MRVAIVGAGLAGLTAAVDLVDAGHSVDLYEARPFLGGKVASWEDAEGNHIEMGLHVFFFNYANLFALMRKVGAIDHLLPKDHTHLFVNRGGDLRSLDFRFPLGAPFNGLKAFFTTISIFLHTVYKPKQRIPGCPEKDLDPTHSITAIRLGPTVFSDKGYSIFKHSISRYKYPFRFPFVFSSFRSFEC